MSHKRIELTIDTEGKASIDAIGFNGMGCVPATEFLEQALGQTGTRRRKPEFFRSRSTTLQQRLGGRRRS